MPRPEPSALDLVRWKLQWCAANDGWISFRPDETQTILDALDATKTDGRTQHEQSRPDAWHLNIGDRVTVRLQGRIYESVVDSLDFVTGAVTLQATYIGPRVGTDETADLRVRVVSQETGTGAASQPERESGYEYGPAA